MNDCYDPEVISVLLRYAPESPEAGELRSHASGCARCHAALVATANRMMVEQIKTASAHLPYEVLNAYRDPAIDAEAQSLIRAHLDACPECAEQLALLGAERSRAQDKEPPPWMRAWPVWRQRPVLLLGGPAIATAALLLLWVLPRTGQHQTVAPGKSTSVPANQTGPTAVPPVLDDTIVHLTRQDDGKLAARVDTQRHLAPSLADLVAKSLSHLEQMLPLRSMPASIELKSLTTRGSEAKPGSSSSNVLQLIAPVDAVVLTPTVTLRWHSLPGHDIRYTVYSGEAGTPVNRRLGETSASTLPVHVWQPGHTYYWRVFAQDAHGNPLSASKPAWLRVMPADKAAAIMGHPDAHLLRGVLYETESALPQALSEYSRLPVTMRSQQLIDQLKARVRKEMKAGTPHGD